MQMTTKYKQKYSIPMRKDVSNGPDNRFKAEIATTKHSRPDHRFTRTSTTDRNHMTKLRQDEDKKNHALMNNAVTPAIQVSKPSKTGI